MKYHHQYLYEHVKETSAVGRTNRGVPSSDGLAIPCSPADLQGLVSSTGKHSTIESSNIDYKLSSAKS